MSTTNIPKIMAENIELEIKINGLDGVRLNTPSRPRIPTNISRIVVFSYIHAQENGTVNLTVLESDFRAIILRYSLTTA